ncbi:ABC multidrug transporter-like protein [Ophiobolus disseminans]|uniref:ABC multidrug transporter-like protein n=1 Tax=Ophiobolus disseminans TaxID=1469910 RepID=A0A6A7A2A6_9PLEO|nr:ABC multidrug transporter-like protein [Ophiobolus disseminans]
MTTINEYVLYIVYLFIGRCVLAYFAILGFRIASLRISAAIRLHYLQALFQQPISTLDALPAGQTTAIITITANILQLGISERFSSLIQAIAVIVVALVIGCVYSWALTLVTACGLVVVVTWYAITTPILAKKYAAVQALEREAAGVAAETLSGIRMVAACGAERKIGRIYGELTDHTEAMSKRLSPLLAVQHSPEVYSTHTSSVLLSVMTMIAHLNAISVPLTAASNAMNAASIFFTIIDAPKPTTTGVSSSDASMANDIQLRNVNFAYPSRHDVRVLNDFNLHIRTGQTTAIVGPTGSGKSTVVALISRWYELGGQDPIANYLRNGEVTIGGRNLKDIDLFWWRSQVGLVQQEPFLFNDTIYKNVEYGLVGTDYEHVPEHIKQALVEQACRDAYADIFIRNLPGGYFTPVGEVGLQLSGGQRQRLAIARAIVRKPSILIFDEATSALDVSSERIVQAALAKASQGRTTIVIAHRLSTIKAADHIAVVTRGHVVQQGTHDALLEDVGGAYWELVNAQHSWNCKSEKTFGALEEKDSCDTLVESNVNTTKLHVPQGFFGSFAMLLLEQKRNWVSYTVMLVAAAGAGSTSALQAYLFARLISGFAYWGKQLVDTTSFLCLMLLVVAVGVGLSYFVLGWISNNASTHTVSSYRREYFDNIIAKRISFFDDPQHASGLLTTRIATDPAQLQQLLGINMAMVMISIFNVIGCITIAIFFHWKFGLVVIASSLPLILAGGWYRVRHEVRFESRNNQVFADSARFATEAISAIRTVASLTLERTICARYDDMLKEHVDKSLKEARVSCAVFAMSDSLVLLCMAFALWYGGTLLANGSLQSFNFLVVYLAVIQGSLAAGQWLSFGPNIAQVSAAANRIQAMRSNVAKEDHAVFLEHEKRHRRTISTSILWKGADIEFRNVCFKYPSRDVPVLRNLSIKIQHGQFAAIVGSSGAGKTSVISLLERFYEPQSGSIYYNGEDITSIPMRSLRQKMSLVAQEPYIFRGTIRDNVLLGVNSAETSEDAIHQACHEAGIHDFIVSLPDGYNTDVGKAGVSLSGGQRQRISIARALIRDPSILLLDEATSSLDSETEKEVQAVFEQTGEGRTMIVVAHRLSTVQNADVIFVMHEALPNSFAVFPKAHDMLGTCCGSQKEPSALHIPNRVR